MAAYLKIGDIKGESTDKGHKDWINLDHMNSSVMRSIKQGAKDQERSRGTTTLNDISLARPLDKSSVKLSEACAKGTFFPEAEINFCTQVKGKEETYLAYKLKNVIITSYNVDCTGEAQVPPTEGITLNFTDIEWTYTNLDSKTGDKAGNVAGKYSLGERA